MKRYQGGGNVGMSERAMINQLRQMNVFKKIQGQVADTSLKSVIGQISEKMQKEWDEKVKEFERKQKKAHGKHGIFGKLVKTLLPPGWKEAASGVMAYDIAKELQKSAKQLNITGYGDPGTRFGDQQKKYNVQAKEVQEQFADPTDAAIASISSSILSNKLLDVGGAKGEDIAAGAPQKYGRIGTNIRKQFGLGEGEKFFGKYFGGEGPGNFLQNLFGAEGLSKTPFFQQPDLSPFYKGSGADEEQMMALLQKIFGGK